MWTASSAEQDKLLWAYSNKWWKWDKLCMLKISLTANILLNKSIMNENKIL